MTLSISTLRPKTLTDLPPEILLNIVGRLNPIASVCLSILSKNLHKVHRVVHGSVSLNAPTGIPYQVLGHLLADWATRQGLVYDIHISPQFVTKERMVQLERQMKETQRNWDEGQRLLRRFEKHGRGGGALTLQLRNEVEAEAERISKIRITDAEVDSGDEWE